MRSTSRRAATWSLRSYADTSKTAARSSDDFERELAEHLDGRRIFLSGAGLEKADVRAKQKYVMQDGVPMPVPSLTFRAEAKTTERSSYTFNRTDWVTLARTADSAGENPVFAIRFLRERRDIVIVRQSLMGSLALEVLRKIPGYDEHFTVVKKSRIVRATSYGHFTLMTSALPPPNRPTVLVVMPLHMLLTAIHEYTPE